MKQNKLSVIKGGVMNNVFALKRKMSHLEIAILDGELNLLQSRLMLYLYKFSRPLPEGGFAADISAEDLGIPFAGTKTSEMVEAVRYLHRQGYLTCKELGNGVFRYSLNQMYYTIQGV